MKTIQISREEYDRLNDQVIRQRNLIKKQEKEIERWKVYASVFANKTLMILQGTGYTMEQIMLLYGSLKGVKNERTNQEI